MDGCGSFEREEVGAGGLHFVAYMLTASTWLVAFGPDKPGSPAKSFLVALKPSDREFPP